MLARRVQTIRRLGLVVVALTFAVMVMGSWVKANGVGLSCPDWPRCYGEWLPPFPSAENGGMWEGEPVDYTQAEILYEWTHRALVTLVAPVLVALAVLALRERGLDPTLRFLPGFAGMVLLVQIVLGGLTVLEKNPAWATTLHLATATIFFGLVTMTSAWSFLRPLPAGAQVVSRPREAPEVVYPGEPSDAPEAPAGRAAGAIIKDYVTISKPRIITLLLVVAWAAMFVASKGIPPLAPFIAVTLAGTFSTAASGAFNNVIERDRDRSMVRTADRPVATGRISPASALIYASIMTLLSFAALAAIEAWLAALLTLGAIAYYVVVYTVMLKPNTAQSIVIGGLAGSFPAVIGWSAVTGTIGLASIVLAVLVFVWTPAHFWALALLYKKDYAAADYPMLPNTRGERATRKQILFYSGLTVLVSIALVFPMNLAGIIYLGALAVLGLLLLYRANRLETHPSPQAYRSFFFFTIQYLGLLLIALMVDQVLFFSIQ